MTSEAQTRITINSGHRIEDHFADVSKMIEIGKGGKRKVKTMRRKPKRN